MISMLFLAGISLPVVAQKIWTVGPMIHLNFGGEKKSLSYGLEVGYWLIREGRDIYCGLDGGIEFERKKIRLYGEAQAGIGITGISGGPVLEFNKEQHKVHPGFQASAWANFIIGADFRRRWIDKESYNCPGMYLKVPIPFGVAYKEYKEYGEDDSNSSWDWD